MNFAKPRVVPISRDDAPEGSLPEWDNQVNTYGRMTNMKMTLARNPQALNTYMQWYPLEQELESFLGRRLTFLFAHSISSQTDCLICSTYFRRHLIESGEDPDNLILNEMEKQIVDLGRQIANDPHAIPDELFEVVTAGMTDEQKVVLVAFAGQMVATNIINNVLNVSLDEYLMPYKKEG